MTNAEDSWPPLLRPARDDELPEKWRRRTDQVGRVYAAEIMQKAPAGTWFLGEGGGYTRK